MFVFHLRRHDQSEKESGQDAFAAIIASDNGKGVAFLLADHIQELGNKVIVKIYTYLGKSDDDPIVFFQFGNAIRFDREMGFVKAMGVDRVTVVSGMH